MSHRLLAVVAHPDDDTFGCAGTVALHAEDPDLRFTLIHVTSGEAGEIADPALATRATLGEVREDEDRRSWVALGRVPERHEFFRLPDGGLERSDRAALAERIAEVMRQERPDVISTFGPEGVTGHPDHIAVGRAATEAFHAVRADAAEGMRRLLHVGLPISGLLRYNEILVAMGQDPVDLEHPQVFQPHGVPDGSIGVVVDCEPVAERKLAALAEHRTQADDLGSLPDEVRRAIVATESHVIAWPPRNSDAPVLTDVFEALG
jgi:LmbE family N-acetylglucosaminyl deacetylase